MRISQIILVVSSIMVLDAKSSDAKHRQSKNEAGSGKKTAKITNTQSDVNSANMAGLMARVRRGGWDRN